jgi:hypothetical protein
MNEIITVNENELKIKEFGGYRVVTFNDIDQVHKRPIGTASRNFKTNRKHFIENEDYFTVKPKDIQKDDFRLSGITREDINNRGTTLLTESGYLMIVKSFTDDLAWDIQRKLIKSYFKLQETQLNDITQIDYSDKISKVENQMNLLLANDLDFATNIKEIKKALSIIYRMVSSNVKLSSDEYKPVKDVTNEIKLWKNKMYTLADELVTPKGNFESSQQVLNHIYNIMRSKYGVVWEQEIKDYMNKYNCSKPSTITLVTENLSYKSILETILNDMVSENNKCNDFNCLAINDWNSAQEYVLELSKKINDNTPYSAHTYRVIYKLMDENNQINWDRYTKKYKKDHRIKTNPSKKQIISDKSRLQKMFINELIKYSANYKREMSH